MSQVTINVCEVPVVKPRIKKHDGLWRVYTEFGQVGYPTENFKHACWTARQHTAFLTHGKEKLP